MMSISVSKPAGYLIGDQFCSTHKRRVENIYEVEEKLAKFDVIFYSPFLFSNFRFGILLPKLFLPTVSTMKPVVKLIYSEKATKFCEISTVDLTALQSLTGPVQGQNRVFPV